VAAALLPAWSTRGAEVPELGVRALTWTQSPARTMPAADSASRRSAATALMQAAARQPVLMTPAPTLRLPAILAPTATALWTLAAGPASRPETVLVAPAAWPVSPAASWS